MNNNKDTYPENLMRDILQDETPEQLPADSVETIEHLFGGLSEKYALILKLRYIDGKTLQEIGDGFGITRERVRQLQRVAVNKLRAGERKRILELGEKAYAEALAERHRQEEALLCSYLPEEQSRIKFLMQNMSQSNAFAVLKYEKHMGTDDNIKNLKLSTRPTSVLSRKHISSVAELCSLSEKNLLAVPGCGVFAAHEIEKTLSGFGLTLREDIPA